MAVIRSIKRTNSDVKRHRTEVDCGWTVVRTDGGPLLHLSTYGSDDRHSEPKVSQTIQLDVASARELASIIEDVFGASR